MSPQQGCYCFLYHRCRKGGGGGGAPGTRAPPTPQHNIEAQSNEVISHMNIFKPQKKLPLSPPLILKHLPTSLYAVTLSLELHGL